MIKVTVMQQSANENHKSKITAIPEESGAARSFLDYLCGHRADYRQFQKRRRNKAYVTKLNACRNVWIAAALAMLLHPVTGFVVPVALFATFLSFAILDGQ